ncbi:MAG: biosynthetic arginine decarboxylase [Acidobacteria bacterium]|nr:biosynthetic arginine decarboxylase [Acidobacteriota bacterium]
MVVRIPVEEALDVYGIHLWGAGYFGISQEGELTVRPTRNVRQELSLPRLVQQARDRGIDTPILFRFPQILKTSVEELVGSFRAAREEFGFQGGSYSPAFPMKVNQNRAVVEALLEAGRAHNLSLEVGSRAELMAALAMDLGEDALTIVNGYKDSETFRLASLGARIGRRVVVVIEKEFEIDLVLRAMEDVEEGALPEIGIRVRLFAKGSGKWWKSSGLTAKFGLTTTALLGAVSRLREAGRLDRLSMVHFHIGSQIPDIRRLKAAFREGARIYAKLRRMGVPVSVLNVGGGLAVDYDGSNTASDASRNYSISEYANDAVFIVKDVCSEEKVPLPLLVSESGRALTAYHSLLVTNTLHTISADPPMMLNGTRTPAEKPRVVQELRAMSEDISGKTYREYYHDAIELRDEMATLFNHGLVPLEDRALAEQLFWEIARKALTFARREKIPLEEFEQLEQALDEKYVLNFSVFQSVPDHWALEQLFPIVPISRLREEPDHKATLCDITCDSDGEIDHFVDIKDVKEVLPLHAPVAGQSYDLAILMLGAYQDVMGDLHNLFGAPDEIHVTMDEDGVARIDKIVEGDTVADVLQIFGYPHEELSERVRVALDARVGAGSLTPHEAKNLHDAYRDMFDRGTYLKRSL